MALMDLAFIFKVDQDLGSEESEEQARKKMQGRVMCLGGRGGGSEHMLAWQIHVNRWHLEVKPYMRQSMVSSFLLKLMQRPGSRKTPVFL